MLLTNVPPGHPGAAMLAAYIQGHPDRPGIVRGIMQRLNNGELSDAVRGYVSNKPFRRATLRGILISLSLPIPDWAVDSIAAANANKAFRDRYRNERGHLNHSFGASAPISTTLPQLQS